MNKKISSLIVITLISFVGVTSYAFAATHATSGNSLNKKHSPAIVGVVTGINGTNITVTGRDNNTYTVDASGATVVTGFLGHFAKPSSFSNIQVTDILTIKGKINGYSIHAKEIADNKTPKNVASAKTRLNINAKNIPVITPQDTIRDVIVSTTTSPLATSTTDVASSTATSTASTTPDTSSSSSNPSTISSSTDATTTATDTTSSTTQSVATSTTTTTDTTSASTPDASISASSTVE